MITPFPVTENELKVLKKLKNPLTIVEIKQKFAKKDRMMVEGVVSRMVCYGVVIRERIEYRTHPKTTYAKTLYVFDGRDLVVKDDQSIKSERSRMTSKDNLFMQFGETVDPSVQKQIVDLAGEMIPRSEIAKLLGLKKLLVIQVIIANEKEVEAKRRAYERKNKAVIKDSESA